VRRDDRQHLVMNSGKPFSPVHVVCVRHFLSDFFVLMFSALCVPVFLLLSLI
jgi:hypothetical protein